MIPLCQATKSAFTEKRNGWRRCTVGKALSDLVDADPNLTKVTCAVVKNGTGNQFINLPVHITKKGQSNLNHERIFHFPTIDTALLL